VTLGKNRTTFETQIFDHKPQTLRLPSFTFNLTYPLDTRAARFVFAQYTKVGKNVPHDYEKAENIPNGQKIYQHFPPQGPPKFTQIRIFGLEINHLATLLEAVLIV
jgi:hypothetical protein